MLAYLEGEAKQKGPNFVILMTKSGVGYLVNVPVRLIGKKKLGLFIYHYQTEKSEALYGFSDFKERELFGELLKVPGLGPKGALGLLSFYSPTQILEIISQGDVNKIEIVPGIGRKTARKILAELSTTVSFESKGKEAIIEALKSLGFTLTEAQESLKYLDGSENTLESQIKKILKERGKNV